MLRPIVKVPSKSALLGKVGILSAVSESMFSFKDHPPKALKG